MYVANDLNFTIAHWGFMGYTCEEDKHSDNNYVDGSDIHWMLFTEVQWAVVTHTKHMSVANMLTMYFPF